ncbi:lycopene cyclase domain-containing protein [Brevibacterium samyangense]|uniref:Lycopene cyclase domain-containing protein n=1 Tax=Brevibacterium samyangense TaxID=366888 RepID=A0ABP5F1C6_9MICO
MKWLYLGCLLFSTFGMCMLDLRYRLFWFAHWRRAALVHGFGVLVFLLWDVAGILTGSFSQGDSPYFSGISLAPEMSLEEPFFLFFLCWITMNVYCGSARLVSRARGGRAGSRTASEPNPADAPARSGAPERSDTTERPAASERPATSERTEQRGTA